MVIAIWAVREIARTAWGLMRGPVIVILQLFAALIVLFEEWGWKPLAAALAWLARFAPVARLEAWIASLRPYPSLFVFAAPTALLLPVKFAALWLLAQGHFVTATGLLVAAKIASTALVARLFTLTQPALMRITWFARAYNAFMPWKDAFFATIRASWPWRYGRMLKTAIRQRAKRIWVRLKPSIQSFAQSAAEQVKAIVQRVREIMH